MGHTQRENWAQSSFGEGQTIATVLREHGIEPAPERVKKTTWTEGLGNQLIVSVPARAIGDGRILSRERLGGLLKYYHRPAA